MKKYLLLALLNLITLAAFAGPFGLSMGMTLEEVEKECSQKAEYISDDRYYIKPIKSHPSFETYIVWISETEGLYAIKGISSEMYVDDYGKELKQAFKKVLSPLEKKYGRFTMTDTISNDTIYKSEQFWTSALADGARTYMADKVLQEEENNKFEGILNIYLGTGANVLRKAVLWIEYIFTNSTNAFNSQDDVL